MNNPQEIIVCTCAGIRTRCTDESIRLASLGPDFAGYIYTAIRCPDADYSPALLAIELAKTLPSSARPVDDLCQEFTRSYRKFKHDECSNLGWFGMSFRQFLRRNCSTARTKFIERCVERGISRQQAAADWKIVKKQPNREQILNCIVDLQCDETIVDQIKNLDVQPEKLTSLQSDLYEAAHRDYNFDEMSRALRTTKMSIRSAAGSILIAAKLNSKKQRDIIPVSRTPSASAEDVAISALLLDCTPEQIAELSGTSLSHVQERINIITARAGLLVSAELPRQQDIARLLASNLTKEEISQRVGCKVTDVDGVIRELRLGKALRNGEAQMFNDDGSKISPATIEAVRILRRDGISVPTIAVHCGVDQSIVRFLTA